MKKTLLDLDKVPTLEELRAFFKENDFSAASFMDTDPSKLDSDTYELLQYIKSILNTHWEPLMREMGLQSASVFYGADNPLIVMREQLQDLIAGAVIKLIDEHPERVMKLIENFEKNKNPNMSYDDYVRVGVKLLLEVVDFRSLAQFFEENKAQEDYKQDKGNNYRAKDFKKAWYHTETLHPQVSLNEMEEMTDENGDVIDMPIADINGNIESSSVLSLALEKFMKDISQEDQQILIYKKKGLKLQEIADLMGLKTHSAVSKRLANLKERFISQQLKEENLN